MILTPDPDFRPGTLARVVSINGNTRARAVSYILFRNPTPNIDGSGGTKEEKNRIGAIKCDTLMLLMNHSYDQSHGCGRDWYQIITLGPDVRCGWICVVTSIIDENNDICLEEIIL